MSILGLETIIHKWLDETRSGHKFRIIHFCRREANQDEDWPITRIVNGRASTFQDHFEAWVSTPRFIKYIWRYNLATFPRNVLERYENQQAISSRYAVILEALKICVLELAPTMLDHILKGYGQRWTQSNLVELFANTSIHTYRIEATVRLNAIESNWNRATVWQVPEWDKEIDGIDAPNSGCDVQDDDWEEDFNFHTEW